MLVRTPELNDKVEEVDIVSTACVGKQGCVTMSTLKTTLNESYT